MRARCRCAAAALPPVAAPDGNPLAECASFVSGFAWGSVRSADVKVGGEWRSYIMFGEGPGGTFYQTLDVTTREMNGLIKDFRANPKKFLRIKLAIF